MGELEASSVSGMPSTESFVRAVRTSVDAPDAQILSAQWVNLGSGVNCEATESIWRVRGMTASGPTRSSRAPFDLVAKVLGVTGLRPGKWSASDARWHPFYFAREAELVAAGVLEGLSGGLVAPRQLASERTSRRLATAWMEFVPGIQGADVNADVYRLQWSDDRLLLAARHFGQSQGKFLTGEVALSRSLALSRHWLAEYLQRSAFDVGLARSSNWQRSPVLSTTDELTFARCLNMWEQREQLLNILHRLPQTLVHNDPWPGNLFDLHQAGNRMTCAIDWAFGGVGAVGQDIGALVVDIAADCLIEGSDIEMFGESMFSAYAQGLLEVGWRGDMRLARLGFASAVAAKYSWFAGALAASGASDSRDLNDWTAVWSRTSHDPLEVLPNLFLYSAQAFDLARSLASSVELPRTQRSMPSATPTGDFSRSPELGKQ